jgi:hypothetical protein
LDLLEKTQRHQPISFPQQMRRLTTAPPAKIGCGCAAAAIPLLELSLACPAFFFVRINFFDLLVAVNPRTGMAERELSLHKRPADPPLVLQDSVLRLRALELQINQGERDAHDTIMAAGFFGAVALVQLPCGLVTSFSVRHAQFEMGRTYIIHLDR